MFKNLRKEIKKMWEQGQIFIDPAPDTLKGLREMSQAVLEDLKEMMSKK